MEIVIKKTPLELIMETVEAYKGNSNRAIEGGQCKYLTEDGRKCAVGRCMNDGPWQMLNVTFILLDVKFEECIKPEYHDIPIDLFYSLQEFHDDFYNKFFMENDVTDIGKDFIGDLIIKYTN